MSESLAERMDELQKFKTVESLLAAAPPCVCDNIHSNCGDCEAFYERYLQLTHEQEA